MASSVLLVSESLEGHRASYIAFFKERFTDLGVESEVTRLSFWHVFDRRPLFSLMLEEHPLRFLAIAAIRVVLGARSTSLLFRPREAATGRSIRHALKRVMLKSAIRLPGVYIVSLIPFETDPSVSAVASDWVFDPQLWDLRNTSPSHSSLSSEVLKRAAGRKVLCALGQQTAEKGFSLLSELWAGSETFRSQWLVVVAGKVRDQREQIDRFVETGGLLIDRFLSDEELLSFYGIGDLIWCCYAPSYDQASGIFGRSIQLGRVPVVRTGSNIEAVARLLRVPIISVPWNPEGAAALILHASKSTNVKSGFKNKSLLVASMSKLIRFLGVATSADH
jgi:hypothetical protein